jgi:hypothetical protein
VWSAELVTDGDSKLRREVALKVLPTDLANDRERLARSNANWTRQPTASVWMW